LRETAFVATSEQIGNELKAIFSLRKRPRRIEAYDVAHISGTRQTAAMSVWQDGRFLSQEYAFSLSTQDSELSALAAFIESRFEGNNSKLPDLILVDGGRSHVKAAAGAFHGAQHPPIIGAVKPLRKHSQISHFIAPDGTSVNFLPESPAMTVLLVLRDEAHELANYVHRESRDMAHFYTAAAILPSLTESERRIVRKIAGNARNLIDLTEDDLKGAFDEERIAVILNEIRNYGEADRPRAEPLIVPLRFDDPNGDASDLRPIEAFKP
jgi:excinuclease ABC subunit C